MKRVDEAHTGARSARGDPAIGLALKRCVEAAHLLVGSSDFAFFLFDAHDGRRLYANAAFDRLVGHDGRAFVGKLPPFPYWVDEPRISHQLEATLDGTFGASGVRLLAMRFRHASGREFDVLVTGNEIRRNGNPIAYLSLAVEADSVSRESALRILAVSETLRAIESAMEQIGSAALALGRGASWRASAPCGLTSRERDVAQLSGKGLRPALIAQRLAISEFTVRNHLKRIYKKTGVHSQAELAARLEAAAASAAAD
jgi:PAS domain S-box-containing protein